MAACKIAIFIPMKFLAVLFTVPVGIHCQLFPVIVIVFPVPANTCCCHPTMMANHQNRTWRRRATWFTRPIPINTNFHFGHACTMVPQMPMLRTTPRRSKFTTSQRLTTLHRQSTFLHLTDRTTVWPITTSLFSKTSTTSYKTILSGHKTRSWSHCSRTWERRDMSKDSELLMSLDEMMMGASTVTE